jgi:hypothetical protein
MNQLVPMFPAPIAAAGERAVIRDDSKGPSFGTTGRGTRRLTRRVLPHATAKRQPQQFGD